MHWYLVQGGVEILLSRFTLLILDIKADLMLGPLELAGMQTSLFPYVKQHDDPSQAWTARSGVECTNQKALCID